MGIQPLQIFRLPIADSELQQSPADPVIHNHYVELGTDEIYGVNPM